MKIKLH